MIVVYTDGAATQNAVTGTIGGWAWWVEDALCRFGNASPTTSNRMELQAVIDALRTLAPQARDAGGIVIYSDSLYVINCFAERWYIKWRKNEWKKANGLLVTEIKNRDLWENLLALYEEYLAYSVPVSFRHIRGHGADKNAASEHIEGNRMADQLAVQAKKLRMI